MLVTDGELLARSRSGDRAAFLALVGRSLPSVYDLVARLLPEQHEADDATRATFVAATGSLPHLAGPVEYRPWLFAIAYEQVADRLRVRDPDRVVDELGAALPDGPDRDVWRAFSSLDTAARAALHLHVRHGCPPEEIAQLLGADPTRGDAFVALVVEAFAGALEEPDDPLGAYASLGNVTVPGSLAEETLAAVAERWGRTASGEPRPWRRALLAAAVLGLTGLLAAYAAPRLEPADDTLDAGGLATPTETTTVAAPPTPPPEGRFAGINVGPDLLAYRNGTFVVTADPGSGRDQPERAATGGTPEQQPPTDVSPGDDVLWVRIETPEDGLAVEAIDRGEFGWGAWVQASARANDPEQQRLAMRWVSNHQDYELGHTGQPNLWLALPDGCPDTRSPLLHTVAVEVTDPDGNTAVDAIDVEVRCPPED